MEFDRISKVSLETIQSGDPINEINSQCKYVLMEFDSFAYLVFLLNDWTGQLFTLLSYKLGVVAKKMDMISEIKVYCWGINVNCGFRPISFSLPLYSDTTKVSFCCFRETSVYTHSFI